MRNISKRDEKHLDPCSRCEWKPWEKAMWKTTALACTFILIVMWMANASGFTAAPICGHRVGGGRGNPPHIATSADGCVKR